MATPSALEAGAGPLELVDTYVQVVSPEAAYEPFCGKIVSWDGPDAGYTVRKMGTCQLLSAILVKDMQFIPQKYSSMLGSSPLSTQLPETARACQQARRSSTPPAVTPVNELASTSRESSDEDVPISKLQARPATKTIDEIASTSRDSSDEDIPISKLQTRRAEKVLTKDTVPLEDVPRATSKAVKGTAKLPATASRPESYAVRIQIASKRCQLGNFTSAAAAGRAYTFMRMKLGTRGGDVSALDLSGEGQLLGEEEAYAMKCLRQLQGELAQGENQRNSTSFIGVRVTSSSFDKSYEARIKISKQTFSLGCFHDAQQAAAAYDCAVRLSRVKRKTNFPTDKPLDLPESEHQRIAAILSAANSTPTPNTSSTPPLPAQKTNFSDACARFERLSNEGPVFVCTCCRRTWFRRSVHKVTPALRQRTGPQNVNNWFTSRLSVDNAEWICTTCYNYVSKSRTPPMAPSKQPDLPAIPPALQGLTSMENDLIALRLAFIRIRGLPPSVAGGPRKLGQRALKGMVTNVPADLSKIQLSLPRQLSGEGIIPVSIKYKLKYRASYKTAENVRPHRLREALQYLVSEPTLWKEAQVSIRTDWLRQSEADAHACRPHDADTPLTSDDASNSSDEEENGPGVEPLPEEETFVDDLYVQPTFSRTTVNVAPGEDQTPVGMLQDIHGEEKCFPSLFAGCARPPSSLSYNQLTRFELTNVDRRFASHASSLFYKLRKLQVIQLNRLGKMRVRKSKLEGRQPLTAAEVRDTSARENLLSKNIGFRDLKTLRSSPDYDREGKREAFGMIRQIGPFQLFCTFSMAETRWGGLLRTLHQLASGEDISEAAALALPWERKATLIRDDPVSTARCYCNRRDLIFSTLSQCSQFVGQGTDFFWRDEFQKRGTAHTHAAFYIAGAPRFGISTDAEICAFIDDRITCSLTEASPSDIQGQQHNHLKRYCLKDPDPAGNRVCRFDFPRVPSFSTMLLRPLPEDIPSSESRSLCRIYKQAKALINDLAEADLENMSTFDFICRLRVTRERYTLALRASVCKPTVFLKRAPIERRVNPYNPRLLQILHTNMDCQFALDVYAAANYITSYMMKTDLKMSKLLRAAYREASLGNMGLQQSVRHAGSAFIRGQEVCAQQAVYGCLGLPLRYCSRNHIFIPSSRPSERTFLLKDDRYLKSLPPDSTNCVHASVVDRYAARLLNGTLQGTELLCLSDMPLYMSTPRPSLQQKKMCTTMRSLNMICPPQLTTCRLRSLMTSAAAYLALTARYPTANTGNAPKRK